MAGRHVMSRVSAGLMLGRSGCNNVRNTVAVQPQLNLPFERPCKHISAAASQRSAVIDTRGIPSRSGAATQSTRCRDCEGGTGSAQGESAKQSVITHSPCRGAICACIAPERGNALTMPGRVVRVHRTRHDAPPTGKRKQQNPCPDDTPAAGAALSDRTGDAAEPRVATASEGRHPRLHRIRPAEPQSAARAPPR